MKKIIISVIANALLLNNTYSQEPRLGFTGGVTFSNLKAKSKGTSASGDTKTGITLGIIVNVPVGKGLAIQPGVNWTQKGTTDKESSGNLINKTALTINYIEIPVNLLYKSKGFFIGTGLSMSSAMEGHLKTEFDGETETEDVDFGNDDEKDMRQLDLGVNVLAGYELPGGFFFSVNFNQGLTNLQPGDAADDIKVKSYYFGIRLGYLINGKK